MPRVLQLSPRLPFPLDDGGRIATWNFSRCLHHNGYDVDLLCFGREPGADRPHRARLDEVFASVATVPRDVERQYPLTLARALVTGQPYFTRKYHSRVLEGLIEDRLTRHAYDATLVDSAYMGVYVPALRRRRDRAGRVVLRQHNVEHELLSRLVGGALSVVHRVLLRREARRFRTYELDLVDRVDAVLMITVRDADVLRDAGARKPLDVLPPFIDIDRYQPDASAPIEPGAVVCVGNMAWMPNMNGVSWFLDAVWPRVIAARPDAKFYVVGKNPPPAIRRHAGPNVVVTGYVDDERPYIRRGHLFVVPLLEGSGIRIKILTAMAMGRPIVSTTLAAEGIEWNGLDLQDTADGWVTAIVDHLDRPPAIRHDAVEFIRDHYSRERPFQF